jgi:hypothetical protein
MAYCVNLEIQDSRRNLPPFPIYDWFWSTLDLLSNRSRAAEMSLFLGRKIEPHSVNFYPALIALHVKTFLAFDWQSEWKSHVEFVTKLKNVKTVELLESILLFNEFVDKLKKYRRTVVYFPRKIRYIDNIEN